MAKPGLTCNTLTPEFEQDKSIDDVIKALWQDYKNRPETGLEDQQVFDLIENLSSKAVGDHFKHLFWRAPCFYKTVKH